MNSLRLMNLMTLLSASALLPGLAGAQSATDPAPMVEKIVQAYGGRAALERVNGVKHTGTIQSFRLGKTGTLARLYILPSQLRVDLNYPDGPHEQRITTPQGAWRDGRPTSGPMHTAMLLQVARFRLPLLLTENPVSVLGEEKGRLHLGVMLSDSTSMEVFVDRETWRIMRSVGRMAFRGMNMAFTADYSDFRMVDGMLFPHREDLTAMGTPTGIAILERIELNPQIRPEDFKP